MKMITEASKEELVNFFLSDEAYCNLSLPSYFSFSSLLKETYKLLSDTKSPFYNKPIKHNDAMVLNVNHSIICNKNNGFSWRKITLINPYVYVHSIIIITNDEFWPIIKGQFSKYLENEKIIPLNLPFIKDNKNLSPTAQIINNWWSSFENKSLALSLEYEYMARTDISNCYDSIYSHSLEWVFSSREVAKKKKATSIGSEIDKLIRTMNEGQTNGILTGSEMSNLFAELVLGDVDLKLRQKLDNLNVYNYKILRYRDDYRIFCNDEVSSLLILKNLSEILQIYGMSLNASKTDVCNDIISSSLKEEKKYSIDHPLPLSISIQKKLFFIYELSKKLNHPKIISKYLNKVIKEVKLDGINYQYNSFESVCGIIVGLIVNNSNVYQSAIALLSFVLKGATADQRATILPILFRKMSKLPNTYYFNIWFQRLLLPYREEIELHEDFDIYSETDGLCNLMNNHIFSKSKGVKIWDYSFVEKLGVSGEKLKILLRTMDQNNIIIEEHFEKLEPVFSENEFDTFLNTYLD